MAVLPMPRAPPVGIPCGRILPSGRLRDSATTGGVAELLVACGLEETLLLPAPGVFAGSFGGILCWKKGSVEEER